MVINYRIISLHYNKSIIKKIDNQNQYFSLYSSREFHTEIILKNRAMNELQTFCSERKKQHLLLNPIWKYLFVRGQ